MYVADWCFFLHDTATTEIYTLSLHDALPLFRRGEASRVSSLFFLVPPVTALVAWPVFGETFGPLALAGMVVTVIGVAMVNLEKRGALPKPPPEDLA